MTFKSIRARMETSKKGLGTCIVRDLTHSIAGKGHIVNCDNFFTSPELLSGLLEDRIYA